MSFFKRIRSKNSFPRGLTPLPFKKLPFINKMATFKEGALFNFFPFEFGKKMIAIIFAPCIVQNGLFGKHVVEVM